MATRKKTTKSTPPTSSGSQMWKHEALVEYIEAETGDDLSRMSPAEIIAAGFKYRNQFRKTSTYEDLVEGHREEAAERRKEAQKARRASSPKKKAPAKKTAAKKAPAKRRSRK